MKAEILGEDTKDIGVEVTDNLDSKHHIELHKENGEIYAHHCDAYADDPDERTETENEHNNQARRFAKWFVYCERGYDTVEHVDNPDYIESVRQAINALSDDDFKQFFGPIHQQLLSHHDSTVDRPSPLPSAVRYPDDVVYEQDIYLGVDPRDDDIVETAREMAANHGLDLDAGMQSRTLADVSASEIEQWQPFIDDLAVEVDTTEVDATLSLDDGAISGIHVSYPDSSGQIVTDHADDPLPRQADARLELLTAEPGALEDFRSYLDHHLRCQIRDCLVGMGLVPPESYRVLGAGKFIYTRRYNHLGLYPELHTSRAEPNRLLG